jgi:ComF family protein
MKIRKKIIGIVYSYLREFVFLFFPKNCSACGTGLNEQEEVLCTMCLYDLPRTNFHKEPENAVEKLFWGLSEVKHATAYFNFSKGSKYREVIHKLKYNGRSDIGVELGKFFAAEISGSVFSNTDIIIPVPLHPSKLRKRGYNQSEVIGEGMSDIMEIPMETNVLVRTVNNETQTKKSFAERRKNVESVFKIEKPELIKNKHILLIDDVITTGSTLMACVDELNKVEGVTVSIAALGFAAH